MNIKFFPRKTGILYVDLTGHPVPMSQGRNPRPRLQLTVFKKQSGIKINLATWDAAKQRVTRDEKQHKFINQEIQKVEDAIWDLVEHATGKLSRESFERAIAGEAVVKDFWGLYGEFLAYVKTNNATGTYKSHKSTLNTLTRFSEEYNITLNGCNTHFFDKFTSYLTRNNIANSTAHVIRSRVITFLKWAKDHGYEIPDFKVSKIKRLIKSHVTLTREEVEKIERLEVSDSVQKAKDLFLWCIYTSMRYGDTQRLKENNIVGGFNSKAVAYYPEKTKNHEIVIPIDEKMQAILDKYESGFTPLPRLSIQQYDRLLKMLVSDAGIDSPARYEKMVGNKIVSEDKKKYELITSHTARRTAITLWAEEGYPLEWIKQRTGHTNFGMIERYISQTRTAKINRDLGGQARVRKLNEGRS